ncbi:uncharacterized protein [Aegilops tauschii subsp. strangulata]|uniref:uncharacterized protein n=1 Tax=Aegilops tauschii subsp. strangulata TaxID=200361 RepID=UPI003CC899B4
MAEEASAKRHCGQRSDQSGNLDVVHVPGQKCEYTVTLKGIELHGKETMEVVCTSEPDKADEMIFRIRRSACGSYPHIIGVNVEFTKMMNLRRWQQFCSSAWRLKMSGLEINPNKHIDIQHNWRVPYNGKPYDSLADVAASVIHPFYSKMKNKIDKQADHKLWGVSPLPDYLIEYTAIDAYATYKSWKIIDNIKRGLEISKEQEEDPYYYCHYVG